MSSYENTSTFQESQKIPLNKDIYNNSSIKTFEKMSVLSPGVFNVS